MENNTQNVAELTFNTCKLARRGKGVKDEFYTVNLLGKQIVETRVNRKGESVEDRDITYDHITPEHVDLILGRIDVIKERHVILAKALDLYLAEKAREALNPVQTLAATILEDGKLTTDSDKARQVAQTCIMLARQSQSTVEEAYAMMLMLHAKKAQR